MAVSPEAVGMAMARSSSNALRRRLTWIARGKGTSRCQLHRMGRTLFAAVGLFVTFTVGSIELDRLVNGSDTARARESFSRVRSTTPRFSEKGHR